MTFTSYAQNFEDVILWRALRHISNGFYIDLGAWSPTVDSVTAAFYAKGWSGINVEPNPNIFVELATARPRDTNLNTAVSNFEGQTELQIINNTGLACIKESTQAGQGEHTQAFKIPCTTLNALVAAHLQPEQDVHFLKIDIEGMESAVINHTDWKRFQPWIVVVEATKPMSMDPEFESWEGTLLASGYSFVYSDGINRFYVSACQANLREYFDYPPNYFDNFTTYQAEQTQIAYTELQEWASTLEKNALEQDAETQCYVKSLEGFNERLQQLSHAQRTSNDRLTSQLAWTLYQKKRLERSSMATAVEERIISQSQLIIDQHLQTVYRSTSWRITAPLRALSRLIKGEK